MGEQNKEALESAVRAEIEELFSPNGSLKDLSGSIDSDVLNLSVLIIANFLRRSGRTNEDGVKEACHIYAMGCWTSHSRENYELLEKSKAEYARFLAEYSQLSAEKS